MGSSATIIAKRVRVGVKRGANAMDSKTPSSAPKRVNTVSHARTHARRHLQ